MDKLEILADKQIKIKTNLNYNLNKMLTHGGGQRLSRGKEKGGLMVWPRIW